MRLAIRGKLWAFRFSDNLPPLHDGDCDPPTEKKKSIRVAKGLDEQTELETVLHEVLHAALWDIKENAVEETAAAQARALWRLGWRKLEK